MGTGSLWLLRIRPFMLVTAQSAGAGFASTSIRVSKDFPSPIMSHRKPACTQRIQRPIKCARGDRSHYKMGHSVELFMYVAAIYRG